jgi:hypothetical protein
MDSGDIDPDFDDDVETPRSRGGLLKIFLISISLVSTTIAANITINNGRIEMGQGLYQIKACDQWVAIGLYPTPADSNGLSKVQTMELIGLDPRLCKNVIFQIKMYKKTDLNTPLSLFTGVTGTDTTTAAVTTGDVTRVSIYDTATVSYVSGGAVTYNSYAAKALTLVNMAGANVNYSDGYHRISYVSSTGVYRIFFTTPLCLMGDVDKVTIESATLPS